MTVAKAKSYTHNVLSDKRLGSHGRSRNYPKNMKCAIVSGLAPRPYMCLTTRDSRSTERLKGNSTPRNRLKLTSGHLKNGEHEP